MAIFKFIFTWTASMAWHLWRVAAGRPYFRGMADTGFTVASFFLVFCAGVILRWAVVAEKDWLDVFTVGLLTSASILLIGCRKDQSDSLVCALMASSAIVDLLAVTATLVGLIGEPRGLGFSLLELGLYLRCISMFAKEDADVRRSGYGRVGKLKQAR